MAAELNAMSADHLEYINEVDCENMAKSGTVATLLPGAFYNLKEQQKPPVSALRAAGVAIAIATDANPGSSASQLDFVDGTHGMYFFLG